MSGSAVRRLGLSVGRQLLIGARGRSLVGAVSTQAREVRLFSSEGQSKYSKEYFDGVRVFTFLCHDRCCAYDLM